MGKKGKLILLPQQTQTHTRAHTSIKHFEDTRRSTLANEITVQTALGPMGVDYAIYLTNQLTQLLINVISCTGVCALKVVSSTG